MRNLSRIMVNLDKIGDAMGVIAILGLVVVGFWVAQGLGLPTGGSELLEAV